MTPHMTLLKHKYVGTLTSNLLVALLYFCTGYFCLQVSSLNTFVAVLFLPAGIALGLCLAFRLHHVLPGIFVGAYLMNLYFIYQTDIFHLNRQLLPLIIALGVACQAGLGRWLIRRYVSSAFTLSDEREILRFIVAVPLICLISSTIGVSSLTIFHENNESFLVDWVAWWAGDSLGTLIALPLVMSFFGKPRQIWRSRRWLMSVQILVSLLIILVLSYEIKQFEDRRLDDRFRIRIQEVGTLFRMALRTEELIQESAAQLFVSSDEVTREEFREFVRWGTNFNQQQIQVVEWLPRITHAERSAYELEQQAYFGPDFTITELVGEGKVRPAGPREVYFPVTFLEPEWDNKPAIGFDPMTSAVSREAILEAIEAGESRARGPLKIIRDNAYIDVLIIYRPLYRRADGKMSLNPGEGEIAGLVNIVIHIEKFINSILLNSENRDFTMKWQDVRTGEFYYQQPVKTEMVMTHEVPFELAGRPMQLIFNPTPYYLEANKSNLANLSLVGGSLLAGLFTLLFLSITGRTYWIAAEVRQRTEELSMATSQAQASERRIREVLEEMRETEQKLLLSDVAFNSTSEAMMITDALKRVIVVNSAFTKITGYEQEDVVGRYPEFLVTGMGESDYKQFSEIFWKTLYTDGIWRGEVQSQHKNGRSFPTYLSVSAVYDDQHNLTNIVAVFADISKVKEAQATIERHANYDTLTDLPNRRLFTDRLEQAILRTGRDNQKLCLMFLDLDRFKDVNDTLGHEFGDALLRQMAVRIRACVRDVDTVARLGGDEFTIILSDLASKSDAVNVASKLITEIEKTITIKGQTLRVTTSIGVTFYPDDALETGMLIQNADRAMYAAKEMGGCAFKFYTSELESSWQSRTFILNELEAAIEKGQIEVYYQPLVAANIDDRTIRGEALVRWQHPERGLIPPAEFLPQAERMGMIEKIDDFVFSQVCQQIKDWSARGLGEIYVSVNRSARNFGNLRGRLNWLDYIQSQGIKPSQITLEITESVLMQQHADGRHLLKKLRQADVQIAVDDFGTGYSSLSYLKEMDVDYLKIDRSFIRDLESDDNDRAIIEAITDMAKHLGIQVVAEGVETESQRDILQRMGCDWLQGYLFARPMPVYEFEQYIRDNTDTVDDREAKKPRSASD